MSMVIIGVPDLLRRLDAIGKGRPILADLQIRTVREAKLRVARKTGFTGRSIRPGTLNDQYATVEVGGAGVFLERGTKPHIIRPRNRRVLAWPATGAGRRLSGRARTATRRGGLGGMAFATVVHHPGTKAQPFLVPAAIAAIEQVGVQPIIHAWNDAA